MRTILAFWIAIALAAVVLFIAAVAGGNKPVEASTMSPAHTKSIQGKASTQTPAADVTQTSTPTAQSAGENVEPLAQCGTHSNYTYTTASGVILETGLTLLPGSQCDDCEIAYGFPFPVTFYGETFNSALIDANGLMVLGGQHATETYYNRCLDITSNYWDHVIFPFWNDWDLRGDVRSGNGIFTKVTGTSPNRTFVVQWRACIYNYYNDCHQSASFEVRFYENALAHPFDFVYGHMSAGLQSIAGVLETHESGDPDPLVQTQFGACGEYNFSNGLQIKWIQPNCLVTPTPTATSTPTMTPTPEPPRCVGEHFADVCPGDYFYEATLALTNAGIISGYNSAPPCPNYLQVPCFKPGSNSTRAQISKIVSLAAGFQEDVSGQTFEDIPTTHTFYQYIERLASRNIIAGYACGGSGEPCVPPNNRPYFLPGNLVTRGQLAKMISIAFAFNQPVGAQMFEDVPPGSTFFDYVQRLAALSVIAGYPCGAVSQPCVPPDNRPYFSPANTATRGQTAKISYLAMNPPASYTPTPTATATFCPATYAVAVDTATVIPGENLVPGSNCDDCVTTVQLPFPVQFYARTFTAVNVSSNGNLQFLSSDSQPANSCLPQENMHYTIMPHWDEQDLTGAGHGVYTTTYAPSPYRNFNIEWKGTNAAGTGTLDYEVRLFENSTVGHIEFIYKTVSGEGTGATIGLEGGDGQYLEYTCDTGGAVEGRRLTFELSAAPCDTPTATDTPSATGTPPVTDTPILTSTPTPAQTGTPTETSTPGETDTPTQISLVRKTLLFCKT